MASVNWKEYRLKDLAKFINGRAFKPSEWELNGLPIIRIQNLTQSSVVVNYTNQQYEDKYLVVKGDLLLAWSATLDVFIWDGDNAWLNQHIFKVQENTQNVLKGFLYYTLKNTILEFYSLAHGSGMVHITKPILENHIARIPSLGEQQLIVERLDAMLSNARKVTERLDKIPLLLKKFKQSVLSAASTGVLTEGWRNTAEKDYRRKKVRDLLVSIKYGTSAKCTKEPIGLPILRIPNIQSGYVDSSDLKYAELDESEKTILQLIEGDLLLVRSNGSVDLVGRTAIVTKKETHYGYAGYLMRLRVDKNKVSPEFLNYCFQSYDMRLQIQLPARSTTGVHNINTTEVKNLELNLPPLDEQQEIVRTINKLFALADSLETRYWIAVACIDKIEQSILAKAFRGELVDPDLDFKLTDNLDECITQQIEQLC